MLSDDERREIDEERAQVPDNRAASIEAMKIVQRHRGWVSDEGLKDIADYLQMSVDDLDGVATFYNLIFREPVGKHVIYLCDSVSCWIMGYPALRERLQKKLGIGFGETTSDGMFTLLPIVCLGTCDHAPAMLIDRETYRDLTPDEAERLVDQVKSSEK